MSDTLATPRQQMEAMKAMKSLIDSSEALYGHCSSECGSEGSASPYAYDDLKNQLNAHIQMVPNTAPPPPEPPSDDIMAAPLEHKLRALYGARLLALLSSPEQQQVWRDSPVSLLNDLDFLVSCTKQRIENDLRRHRLDIERQQMEFRMAHPDHTLSTERIEKALDGSVSPSPDDTS